MYSRAEIQASGDTVEERLAAGADIDAMIEGRLLAPDRNCGDTIEASPDPAGSATLALPVASGEPVPAEVYPEDSAPSEPLDL